MKRTVRAASGEGIAAQALDLSQVLADAVLEKTLVYGGCSQSLCSRLSRAAGGYTRMTISPPSSIFTGT